jgi:hypothetical protein
MKAITFMGRMLLCCAAPMILACLTPTAGAAEEELCAMLDPRLIEHIAISDDCQNMVMLQQMDPAGFAGLYLNAEMLGTGVIRAIAISPNGKRLAWSRLDRDGTSYLYDGPKSQTGYDSAGDSTGQVRFSPNSEHLAYVARKGQDWFVVLDQKEGPRADAPPEELIFGADSQRLGYVLNRDNMKYAVLDQTLGKAFPDIRGLAFSGDGKHVAYAARTESDQWVAVIDGEVRSEAYPQIEKIVMSRDGAHWGFRARRVGASQPERQHVLVVDGKAVDSVNQLTFGPVFSDDGSRLTFGYTVSAGRGQGNSAAFRFHAVVDGETSERLVYIQEAVYSADNRRLAMITCQNASPMQRPAMRYALSVDDKYLIEPSL